jgi:ribose transport system substrate-binding protein
MSFTSKATAVLFGASVLLAACGKGGDANTQKSEGGTPSRIKIAMIAKSSNNPVFLAARTGAEAAAKELSTEKGIQIEVVWMTPPQEDGQVQAQRIAQAVNEGADAILLSCSDAGKVTAAIDDAVARGVSVMTFDSDAPQSKRFAYYGVDDVETGRQVMAELAKQMQPGKVAILAGNQNAPNLQKRVQGVKEEIAKLPGYEVAGVFNHIETPQDAAAEVVRVNNAYQDIKGWAMVGAWPLFTQSLINDFNPAKMKVVAVDALPVELVYVDKGIAPVLLAQPVYMWGYTGVKTIVEKLYDKKEPPTIIPMTLTRVSKDNLGEWARQLKAWGFTDVPEAYLALKN